MRDVRRFVLFCTSIVNGFWYSVIPRSRIIKIKRRSGAAAKQCYNVHNHRAKQANLQAENYDVNSSVQQSTKL